MIEVLQLGHRREDVRLSGGPLHRRAHAGQLLAAHDALRRELLGEGGGEAFFFFLLLYSKVL